MDNNIEIDLNKKNAIFIIGGDNYSSHITPLIASEISTLCEINKNDKRINVILDDFDSMLAIREFTRLLKYSSVTDIRYTRGWWASQDLIYHTWQASSTQETETKLVELNKWDIVYAVIMMHYIGSSSSFIMYANLSIKLTKL